MATTTTYEYRSINKYYRETVATVLVSDEGWTALCQYAVQNGNTVVTMPGVGTLRGHCPYYRNGADLSRVVADLVARLRAGETDAGNEAARLSNFRKAHPPIPMDQGGLEALIAADRPS